MAADTRTRTRTRTLTPTGARALRVTPGPSPSAARTQLRAGLLRTLLLIPGTAALLEHLFPLQVRKLTSRRACQRKCQELLGELPELTRTASPSTSRTRTSGKPPRPAPVATGRGPELGCRSGEPAVDEEQQRPPASARAEMASSQLPCSRVRGTPLTKRATKT